MEKYTILAKIIWYYEDKPKTEYAVLTNLPSLSDALSIIEENYGEELASVELTYHSDPLYYISEEEYNKVKGECI